MTAQAGFDQYDYPGDAEIAWLKANTNLTWCGYYLGPAPSHAGLSWMGKRAILLKGGWGIAPIYVGQQVTGPGSKNPSLTQGTTDGQDAANLLGDEGFPASTCVYLDLENGPPLTSELSYYVAGWADAVTASGYTPGVYCSHAFAPDVHALRSSARIWAFKVSTTAAHPVPGTNFPTLDPAACGYAGAFAWQLGQQCQLTLPGAPLGMLTVDLSVAISNDPGAALPVPPSLVASNA